jgi:hypothetical protein
MIMIVLAGGSLLYANSQGVHPGVTAFIAALALSAGGAALFVRRPISFWVALGGTLTNVGLAIASFALHRPLGLPLPPILSLVFGLYICFRLLLARSALQPIQREPIPDP